MNKYTQTYIEELSKIASAPEASKPNILPKQVAKPSPTPSLTANKDKNILPDSDKTRKLLGIPAGAKPSEADLNDRAGYK